MAKLTRYVGRRRRLPPGAPLFEYADLERQLALQDAVVQVGAASNGDCSNAALRRDAGGLTKLVPRISML